MIRTIGSGPHTKNYRLDMVCVGSLLASPRRKRPNTRRGIIATNSKKVRNISIPLHKKNVNSAIHVYKPKTRCQYRVLWLDNLVAP